MGPYTLVDLHVQVHSRMSITAAQEVAKRVKWVVQSTHPDVSEVASIAPWHIVPRLSIAP
jgi:divalent metal cation (Fe/Co/Zn/Cd) transporter